MTLSTLRGLRAASARASGPTRTAVAQLVAALDAGLGGRPAAAVLWFASPVHDPGAVAGPLVARYPAAAVLGCSTAGEFTETGTGTGGISAVALPAGLVVRSATALADLSGGAAAGTEAAAFTVAAALGGPLRGLDPGRHLALLLVDGTHGDEEVVTRTLGDTAPALDVVGGSAGDDLAFAGTTVAVGDVVSRHGAALAVLELAVPFRVVRTCAFTPSGRRLRVTRTDASRRVVLQFDRLPAVDAYADALGIETDSVDTAAFMTHPVVLTVDGEPQVRSPRATTARGGIAFFGQVPAGSEVDLVRAGDVVAGTRAAIRGAVDALGGRASGAVMFNGVLRRLRMDADGAGGRFVDAFGGIPTAGFHTYGEAWLGHSNHTLTGVVLG